MRKLACFLALLTSACTQKTEPPSASEVGGYRIYVTNETTGDLSIIDSAKMEVVATIPLGKRPRGIHASPDGKTIYVALSGSPIAGPGVDESKLPPADKNADGLGVFDVGQQKLIKVIESGSDPENFDIAKDGKRLFVSNEDASGVTIIDLTTGLPLVTIPTGAEPEGVNITPDGKFVYVTSEDEGTISVVDTGTMKAVKKVKVGRRPRSTAFLPNGTRAYVTAENDGTLVVLDATRHEVIDTIELGKAGVVKPMAVIASQDGKTLYVTTGRGKQLFTVDTATNKPTKSVEVGQRPWGVALSPDGETLFTANGPSTDLSVVDVATMTVTKKIKLTGSPWGVITLPK